MHACIEFCNDFCTGGGGEIHSLRAVSGFKEAQTMNELTLGRVCTLTFRQALIYKPIHTCEGP